LARRKIVVIINRGFTDLQVGEIAMRSVITKLELIYLFRANDAPFVARNSLPRFRVKRFLLEVRNPCVTTELITIRKRHSSVGLLNSFLNRMRPFFPHSVRTANFATPHYGPVHTRSSRNSLSNGKWR
jgi:hypothetical protein